MIGRCPHRTRCSGPLRRSRRGSGWRPRRCVRGAAVTASDRSIMCRFGTVATPPLTYPIRDVLRPRGRRGRPRGRGATRPGNAVRGDVRGSAEHAGPDSGDGPRPPRLGGSAAVRGLLSAVLRLDADTVARTVEQSIAAAGVVSAWDLLCVPALVEVGRRNETGGICIDAEHLVGHSQAPRCTGHGAAPPTAGRGAHSAATERKRNTSLIEELKDELKERDDHGAKTGRRPSERGLLERYAAPARPRSAWAPDERTARVGQ